MSSSETKPPVEEKRKEDFPTFLPSLLVKELRQGLRTRSFVFAMILVPVLMAFPFILHCIYDVNSRPLMGKQEVDVFFWWVACFIILLISPARALWSIYQEKATRSSDLLVLTELSSRRILFQKWVSYTLQSLVLMTILFPFLILRYFLGGVELFADIIRLGFAFLFSMMLTAISLWFSGLPMLYRILGAVGLISAAISVIAASYSAWDELFPLDAKVIVQMAVVAILIVWVTAMFLILAAKNFSPPSENLSAPLRKLLFCVSAAVSGLVSLSFIWVSNHNTDAQAMTMVIIILVYGIISLFEMLLPASLVPAHRETKSGKRSFLSFLYSPFLMPGWQSAALFTLLGVLLMFIPCTLLSGDSSSEGWDFWLPLGLATWASAVFLIMIFSRLFVRIKEYSILIFTIAALLMMGLVSVLGEVLTNEEVLGLLPGGSILAMANNIKHAKPMAWIFILITVLMYIVISRTFWQKYRSYAPRRANEASPDHSNS